MTLEEFLAKLPPLTSGVERERRTVQDPDLKKEGIVAYYLIEERFTAPRSDLYLDVMARGHYRLAMYGGAEGDRVGTKTRSLARVWSEYLTYKLTGEFGLDT